MSGSYFIGLIVALVCAIFVSQDAKKRGMSGAAWGVGVFFLCIVFLPLYFIMRKPLLIVQEPYPTPQPGAAQYTVPPPVTPQYIPPAPAAPSPTPQAGSTRCAACGQYYEGQAAFCPMCGAPQGPPSPAN